MHSLLVLNTNMFVQGGSLKAFRGAIKNSIKPLGIILLKCLLKVSWSPSNISSHWIKPNAFSMPLGATQRDPGPRYLRDLSAHGSTPQPSWTSRVQMLQFSAFTFPSAQVCDGFFSHFFQVSNVASERPSLISLPVLFHNPYPSLLYFLRWHLALSDVLFIYSLKPRLPPLHTDV